MDPENQNLTPSTPQSIGPPASGPTPEILPTGISTEQVPVTPKPKNNLMIFTAVFFVFISLCALGVWAYKNYSISSLPASPKPKAGINTPTPAATTDPTVNWKTYTDKNKEYSLKYPSQYFYQESSDGTTVIFDLQPFKDCSNKNNINCLPANDRVPIFSIVKYSGSQSQYYKDDSDPYHLTSNSTTNIAGKEYNQVLFTLKDTSPSNMPGLYYQSTDTIFPHGNSIVIVSYKKESKDSADYQQIYSQILSTFKFIGATPSAIPSTNGYTCPANGYVDCMPILTPEKQAACSAEAMAWYKANCPDFNGGAY